MKLIPMFLKTLPLLALTACGPLGTYYKVGVTQARLNTDITNCEVTAVQKVPPNKQIRRTPVYFTPASTTCDKNGKCTTVGGYFRGGDVYTVDVNEKLRGRVKAQCMSQKGYQHVEIPRCTSDQLRGKAVAPVQRLPRLSGAVCATKMRNGTLGIVDLTQL